MVLVQFWVWHAHLARAFTGGTPVPLISTGLIGLLTMKRSGIADLPLHGGRVPPWLAQRMTRLGTGDL